MSAIIGSGIVPSTLELIDRTVLDVISNYGGAQFSKEAEALLLIEVDGEESLVEAQGKRIEEFCRERGAVQVERASTPEEAEELWQARRTAFGAVASLRPNCIVEDATVPVKMLPAMIRKIVEITDKYDLKIGVLAHAGDGNLHPLIMTDLRDREGMARVDKAMEELYEAARIDGASGLRQFAHITVPLLRPATLFVAITQTIGVFQVFVVVFIAMLFDFVQRNLLKRLHRKLESTQNPWDDALLQSAMRPLSAMIWIIGITFAADIVSAETQAPLFQAIAPLRHVGIIATLAWFLIRLVSNMQHSIIERGMASGEPYDRTTADAIGKLTRVSILITVALVILQTLGFSVSGVLAFGGIGGIAVGFAARDLLANFFGGLMLYLDRPFSVGDWIRSPDREIEGTVENIGWRLTMIRSFSKRPIYVPNSVFANIAVENPSRMTDRKSTRLNSSHTDISRMPSSA